MNLHEDKKLYQQAVRFTAEQLGIRDIYVEKDYWVTYALYALFHSELKKDIVFKGGTALSKCYKLIQRFSEDIDLVLLRRVGDSNNQLTKKIRKISSIINDILPEVPVKDITQKMGMNRKTAHSYSKEFKGEYGQVRDVIIVEATWLGYHEPYSTVQINSYIYDMMVSTGQQELIEKYNLSPFNVLVLDAKRTLCEKIMSLVRFSYTSQPIEDLNKKIRHTYDIHQLLKVDEIQEFFNSIDFDKLLLKVASDDVASYKSNNEWLEYHPAKAIIFSATDDTWNEMRETYNSSFRNLVFGELPYEKEILKSLKDVALRLEGIKWTIKIKE